MKYKMRFTDCPSYSNERQTLIYYAINKDPAFNNLNEQIRFIFLLNNDNVMSKAACTLRKILHMLLHNTTKLLCKMF